MTFFVIFFCTSALIFVLFIGVFDGSVLLYFYTFQIVSRLIEKEIWDINQFRFLISTRNEWSVLIWDVPYYMHSSYETILLQHLDMGHYSI